MAPWQGILVDTSPYSATPELNLLRDQKDQVIIADYKAATLDKKTYREALLAIEQYHSGIRNGIVLAVWQKCSLRAKYPACKEYRSFEPSPFFEDMLKVQWATEERQHMEALEKEHPLLQPVRAWTATPKSEAKLAEKEEEKKDGKGSVKQEGTDQDGQMQNFDCVELWCGHIVPRNKLADLLSFD